MPSEVVKRFKIHQIALATADCTRSNQKHVGFEGGDDLVYRLGFGRGYSIRTLGMEGEDSESALLCRITIGLACKVFHQSVLQEADEESDFSDVESVCNVETTYDADYIVEGSLDNLDDFDSKEIDTFAEQNVPYHVWPFFREHLSSTLSKMQIQPITIPMLLVPAVHQKTGND